MARIDQVLSGEKSWGKYSLDILGHAGLGAAYSLCAFIPTLIGLDVTPGFTFAAAYSCAILGAVIREAIQYGDSGKLHLLDRSLDVAHHLLGPPIAYGLVQLASLFL